jgi:predicted nucleic acid-binding protein
MRVRYFIDTNVLLYTVSNLPDKKHCALSLLKGHAIISSQVLSESVNVLSRKLKFSYAEIKPIIATFANKLEIYPIEFETVETAMRIAECYKFSYYDSQIIASALEHQCEILYSEDMQDGQVIEHCLRIINPFSHQAR